MNLQIWLLNPYELHFDWKGLTSRVEFLFRPVVREKQHSQHHRFKSVSCNSIFKMPKVGKNDLAVYVVPVPSFGFVAVDFGPCSDPDFMDSHMDVCGRPKVGGLTEHARGEVCSEVYAADSMVADGPTKLIVDRMEDPELRVDRRRTTNHVAILVFHEIMHNIMNERGFHTHTNVRLGRATPPEDGQASQADLNLVARHIGSKNRKRQWMGGFAAVDSRGARVRAPRPQNV
ncbi:MAG: hypothetical protein AAFV88_03795 [Planctomycetota bacterium]